MAPKRYRWNPSDYTGIVAIAVALFSLWWAHSDSVQQGIDLEKSRAALGDIYHSIRTETAALRTVSGELTAANGSLAKLQGHAKDTVEQLRAAAGALHNVVQTSQALDDVDRRTLATAHDELDLLEREHREELTRQNARPKIGITLGYVGGEGLLRWPAAVVAAHKTVALPASSLSEANHAMELLLSNTGDAPALQPIVIIGWSDDLPIAGCPSLYPHEMQCAAPDVLRGGAAAVRFAISPPKAAGRFSLYAIVITRTPSGLSTTFHQSFEIYLAPMPPAQH